MIPISTAITKSGAGATVAEILVGTVGGAGPLALSPPVRPDRGLRPAHQQHCDGARGHPHRGLGGRPARRLRSSRVDQRVRRSHGCVPFTPVATPANMMVMGPGGYRFGDYWRLGLVLVLLFFAVSVGMVPLVWRF